MESRSDGSESFSQGIVILCVGLALAALALDVLVPFGFAKGLPYVLVVLVALRFSRRRLSIQMAVLGSLLTIAGALAARGAWPGWEDVLNRGFALFAIWTATVLGVQREITLREKEEALEKVRSLRGLIAICSSCKKIKDEKGHWYQVEAYISDRVEVEFSHGICPDCAQKFYSDLIQ